MKGFHTIAVVAALALATAAGGQDLFSPGPLARAHASLEGLASCTRCHPKGQQLSRGACLECHRELSGRMAAGRGLHGRLPEPERDCWACHHEHQGKDFALVDWGAGGEKRFDHARTGLPLRGKHGGLACEKCHERKRIADREVAALLEKQPARRTFLGAPAACSACHADEHRGQLPGECQRCHDERGWKPAPLFDHARTAYPLQGKHARVACERCHPRSGDTAPPGPLAQRSPTFARYRPLPHAACTDCHKDPHQGRFEGSCQRCHSPEDWKALTGKAREDRSFHDRTRYRLQGAHAQVACQACHGPFGGEPARYREMAFAACTDCHADAHVGQLSRRDPREAACDRCHSVEGFQPVRFGPAEHARTRYPLDGAHRAAACVACHPRDDRVAQRFPAAVRDELLRRGRPARPSPAILAIAGDLSRCETCHADVHAGQLAGRGQEKGCSACHDATSFRRLRFDHARDARFPLEGKHAAAACASCHPSERGAEGAVTRYKPIPLACASCHADPHAAQFASSPREASDCAGCHGAAGWKGKDLRFRHEPPFTDFGLTGKHVRVQCAACHPEVKVTEGTSVRRYRKLPRTCRGCHVDFHKGAFRGSGP